MPDERKPTSRSRKPASLPRKPASRARTPKDEPRDEPELDSRDIIDDEDLEAAPSDRARPVAVGVGYETEDAPSGALAGGPDEPSSLESDVFGVEQPAAAPEGVVERPLVELGVGAIALLLAATVVLKPFGWFVAQGVPSVPVGAKATGWSASVWGPAVFFLALAVVAIIVLRRLRIPIAFPFETSTMVEGIGYLCVGLLLLTRFFFRPGGWEINLRGWFISIILAAALFLLAGMMSTSAPLVMKPGWFGSSAGKLGVLVLGFSLLAGAAFGFVNDAPGPKECGKDIPQHSTLKELKLMTQQQAGGKEVCFGLAPSSASPATLKKFYQTEFKKLGWKFNVNTGNRGGSKTAKQTVFQMLGPRYGGTVLIFHSGKTSLVNMIVGPPLDFGHCQTTNECITE